MSHASAGSASPLSAIEDVRAFGKKLTEDATELADLAFDITPNAVALATQPTVPVGEDGSLAGRLSDMLELVWAMESEIFTAARRLGLPGVYELDQG